GAPRSPEELARHRCMGVSTIPSNRQWLFQTPSGPRAFDVVPGAAVNNADCVYQFAIAGMGVARLNEFLVAPDLRDGRLVHLLGAALLFLAGFSHIAAVHDGAHDARHSAALPCH